MLVQQIRSCVVYITEPSVAPSQVSARTVSNSITVTWSVPSINDVNGPVDGSKIRLNELRLNPSNKRRKRHIESKVTVIDVKGQQTIKTIQLSEDTVWCIIEVAIYTDNGLGPYSPPLTVHMDKNNTKVNKNGSVNNVDKHGGDNHVGPYHPDKDHDSKNKVDGDNDNMVGAKQSKGMSFRLHLIPWHSQSHYFPSHIAPRRRMRLWLSS